MFSWKCVASLFLLFNLTRAYEYDNNELGSGASNNGSAETEDDQRHQGQEKLRDIEDRHSEDPSDRVQFAIHALATDFKAFHGDGVSFTTLINTYLRATSGDARIILLKMIQHMDSNMDYVIDSEEFVSVMDEPMAAPEAAIDLMFDLMDSDGNEMITKYEWVASQLLSQADGKIMDLWREASQEFYNRDQNQDGKISPDEYIMYELYELAYNMGNDIESRKEDFIGKDKM